MGLYAADASNNPTGSALDQVDVTVSGTAMAAYRVVLNKSALVTPGAVFAVQFSRSGANSSTNYFRVGTYDPSGSAPAYAFKVWNGSSWAARSPAGSALVRVYGAAETSGLVRFYAAKNEGGQFFDKVRIQDASGVYSSSLRSQVYSYQAEIEELLGAGCADGRRMVAQVTPQRVLAVYQAGDASAPDLLIREDGVIVEPGGAPAGGNAVGRWARYAAWPDLPPVWVGKV